ncbi:MAG: error-prone DNA polymerase, partial [Alphaproteobacteria bacterium]|nr:error-prone DNA polymerase [Alphaproteobacteria bacterium]
RRVVPSSRLVDLPDGRRVTVAGLVLVRQRPGTSGVIFMTLEDETGTANVIVWPKLFERFRRAVVGSRLAVVDGTLQREGIVTHVIAGRIVDESALLDGLAAGNGDGHPGHAHADEPSSGRNDEARVRPGRYRKALPNPACHPREVVIPIDSHDFH